MDYKTTRRPQAIPILMYHQVSSTSHANFQKYTVTPNAFAGQMAWLASTGHVPINMDTLLDYRAGKVGLRGRPVVITFDDGFRECIELATPILKRHGFTAVFYLVAGLIGQASRWLVPERGFALDLIDWGEARRLTDFQIGSHSLSHPRLSALSADDCLEELVESRKGLEEHVGYPVRHLAYPFGVYDERVSALAAQAGYLSACSTNIGLSKPDESPFALARVPVTGFDSLADFAWRLWFAYPLGELMKSKLKAAISFRWLARMGQRK